MHGYNEGQKFFRKSLEKKSTLEKLVKLKIIFGKIKKYLLQDIQDLRVPGYL